MQVKKICTVIASAGLIVAGATNAIAIDINTGGSEGAYHAKFCPLVSKALAKAQFTYGCKTSKGSKENIQRVAKAPRQIGFSQADVYAQEIQLLGGTPSFQTIRSDIGRECLFLVTKNKSLTTFGDVAAKSSELSFVLPPAKSGSTGTFEFLKQIDPDGLGRAKNISWADSTDTALDAVLSSSKDDLVTLFVQFPDPDNARFKKIAGGEGRFVPVIDRNILRQEVAGEKIYYPQETEVVNANWIKKGEKLITACTPMLLFTGHPDLLNEGKARADHKDLIRTLKDMKPSEFRPDEGYFSSLFKQTRELTSKGVEGMIDMSEKARQDAQPMLDKAKEASKKALEKAKEYGSQAMEKAGELADDAKKEAEKMMKKEETQP